MAMIGPTSSTCRHRRSCCRSCRCSTPTAGACPMRRRSPGSSSCFCADNQARALCRLFNEERRHPFRRRADRLAGDDRPCRGNGREARQAAARHHRRLGGAAGDDPLVPRARHPRRPPVGHDRDVADRHGRVRRRPTGIDERGRTGRYLSRPGRAMFGVELRIVDDDGNGPAARRRDSSGRLQMRGPAVVKRYFKKDADCVDADDNGSTPATSRSSTPTVRCRSPTAPRT